MKLKFLSSPTTAQRGMVLSQVGMLLPNSPIYGMPILNVEKSKTVMVLKRSMKPGFAGIDNALFLRPNTMMVLGDAKGTVEKITAALKEPGERL